VLISTALADTHASLAWVVVLGNGLAGAWALAAQWVEALRSRVLWWAVGLGYVALVTQVILGVILQNAEDVEADPVHQFYGFFALVVVGIVYSYRLQLAEWRHALFGGGSLFIMGMAIQSMVNAT
jgi:hypothetical protein